MPYPVAAHGMRVSSNATSQLLSDLIAYFPMNENSGDINELVSSEGMLAYNSPGSGPGRVYAAQRELLLSSAQYFMKSVASGTLANMLGPFSIAWWEYPYSYSGVPGTYRYIISNGASSWAGGWEVFHNHSGELVLTLNNVGVPAVFFQHTAITPPISQWNFCLWTYDRATGDVSLKLNSDSAVSWNWSTGPLGPGAAYGRQPAIGTRYNVAAHFDGRLGPIMIWDRVLDALDYDTLYQSGAGIALL